MKFKLDENIPVDLARVLGGLGHDVDTVPQEALTAGLTPLSGRARRKRNVC